MQLRLSWSNLYPLINPMPNPKKPSELLHEKAKLCTSFPLFTQLEVNLICEFFSILDEHHTELATLRKEVEELKKPPINTTCSGDDLRIWGRCYHL